jgi:hypothetical protein
LDYSDLRPIIDALREAVGGAEAVQDGSEIEIRTPAGLEKIKSGYGQFVIRNSSETVVRLTPEEKSLREFIAVLSSARDVLLQSGAGSIESTPVPQKPGSLPKQTAPPKRGR